MHLSTHYYVLSLSRGTNRFYECFRDTAIDIQHQGFPVDPSVPIPASGADDDDRIQDLLREVDLEFDKHDQNESLGLIVIGESAIQSVFETLTEHEDVIVGRVIGDYTSTSPRDVGKIVWPVVKEMMSGLKRAAIRDLEIAKRARRVIFGIEAVSQWVDVVERCTLVVEEDYHVQGSLRKMDHATVISGDVDVREAMDDVVDMIINSVLARRGTVVFMKTGSLGEHQRIGLVLSRARGP